MDVAQYLPVVIPILIGLVAIKFIFKVATKTIFILIAGVVIIMLLKTAGYM